MIDKELTIWENCIKASVFEKPEVMIVTLTHKGKVSFRNDAFLNVIPLFSIQNLINPNFETIKTLSAIEDSLIFKDILTIGTQSSGFNHSFKAYIYKKTEGYLIVCQQTANKTIEQNRKLTGLLQENTNLQRQLLRNKKLLENTLSELDKSNQELKKQIQTKEKIFSIITHDIQSPFSGISGLSEIFYENYASFNDEDKFRFISNLNKATKSYQNLISNLLEWSSLQQNKYNFEPQLVDIYELTATVSSLLKENLEQKNITLKIKMRDSIPFRVDPNMFTGIIRNLISNAIKFTPDKGDIEISAEVLDKKLHFSVKDSGIGMSEDIIQKVLTDEIVTSSPGTKGEKGTGLGLSLCKEFIELHNGSISIRNNPDKGTCVNFILT